MNTRDAIRLKAFFNALIQLESPLPSQLQKPIQQLGELLVNSPNAALPDLAELVKIDERLHELYEQERLALKQEYAEKRNSKGFPVEDDEIDPTQSPFLNHLPTLGEMLQQDNPVEALKNNQKEAATNPQDASDSFDLTLLNILPL